jgi:hypothetical protein
MTPTPNLRFVIRYEPTPIRILQQWWEKSVTINLGWTGDMPLRKAEGEWRDVPLEKEQA